MVDSYELLVAADDEHWGSPRKQAEPQSRMMIPAGLAADTASASSVLTQEVATENDDDPDEELAGVLAKRARELYKKQAGITERVKQDSKELKLTRLRLGETLHGMKAIYSKPGPTGRWGTVLDELGIPRATADRYVLAHENRKASAQGIFLSEEDSPELTPDQITAHVKKLAPKLKGVLRTNGAVDHFLSQLAIELRAAQASTQHPDAIQES